MFGQAGEYVLFADAGVTPADLAMAKKLLGRLNDSVRAGGPITQSLKQVAPDGTRYVAMVGPGTRRVFIRKYPQASKEPETILTALWIPRGFVFVPGSNESPRGWGLPARQQPGDTEWPFGDQNVNPGIEVTRWTAGGPCAQVLLTQDDTAKYPDGTRKVLPIGYDKSEWNAGSTWQPPAGGWHAVRPTFNDFAWSGEQQGARQNLWRSVAARLSRDLTALPIEGYYDDAQTFITFSTKYGADSSAWPVDYKTTAARAYKDGFRKGAYIEVRRDSVDDVELANGLSGASSSVYLDVGISHGTSAATTRDTGDWIHVGNQFWHPSDPSLPTLSWDGYPAQNLPFWLVAGGWTGAVGSAVFPLEGWHYEWRGQTRYVYSKKLYAMGRVIGVLPATVISAAIRVETVQVDGAPGRTKRVNRLVVITWDAADQFGTAQGIAYLWKFRVWCADFDVTPDVPLHVTAVPVGAYDATTNPTGWRACDAFALWPAAGMQVPTGLPDNTLWQMPRFSRDGMQAVAAYGIPPYAPTVQFPLNTVCRLRFDDVAPDSLAYAMDALQLNASGRDRVYAADFDADGNLVWVSAHVQGNEPLTFTWSRGGTLDVAFTGTERVVERWVLDAQAGAMVTSGHFIECSSDGLAATLSYKVRLVYQGALVDVQTFADTAGVYEPESSSDSYLDRLNASFAADRNGNYLMGYDLGVTKNATPVYSAWPVCGSPYPAAVGAPQSAHFGSRWISNVGSPQELARVEGSMRAYPVGVC